MIASGLTGILLAQTGFYEEETPLREQTGWQRFFTLLIYRKHSPKWADVLFFTGCTVIYIAIFGLVFGIPKGILPFIGAVFLNFIPSLFPCMIWNFLVLIIVAAVDYFSDAPPELDDEKTWLLRQVRNLY
jgi:antibiotic biosynthesis monooxygenase (ABM) superfamily enzyme